MRALDFIFTLLVTKYSWVRCNERLIEPYNLPVLPVGLIPTSPFANDTGHPDKLIPRHLWMAFKTVPAEHERPHYLNHLFARNNMTWTIHLEDNDAQLAFMNQHFPNTSLLWAFKQIHPKVGNSAADIWRYAILYVYGGLYMDDDSTFAASFDEIVRVNDTLILSKEKNAYADDCYHHWHKLSYAYLMAKYNATNRVTDINGGRTLVSWAVFAAPRHPIILRTMENIVELVKLEYLRRSAITMSRHDVKWKICMCVTGPVVLTASAREVILETPWDSCWLGPPQWPTGGACHFLQLRVVARDFVEYGGNFKVIRGHAANPTHYMHTMQKFDIPLLKDYAPEPEITAGVYASLIE